MQRDVLSVRPLGFPWLTADPFLFCVFHDDRYPAGNDAQGPAASLRGRDIGQDFSRRDGWSMYHGEDVPGFPQHPHRGFETVTIVRRGIIDHSDSLGASARFGAGDVQWLTAGRGVVHSEMFPLRNRSESNPLELFQIWLNLPRAKKMVAPYFSMFWDAAVPKLSLAGGDVELTVIAGDVLGARALPPPPDSWAAMQEAGVAIWTLRLAPGARWTLPVGPTDCNRTLYFFRGAELTVAGVAVNSGVALAVRPDTALVLQNGDAVAELLVLQGRPIGEPVVQHGPFVMNTPGEIRQAMLDYQQTQFGGWPWPSDGPVHPREQPRFAKHPDGRLESGER